MIVEVAEIVFSSFLSKAVNDTVDVLRDKRKKAIEEKNNQNFSTKIYHVIENSFNAVTSDKYKNTDIMYDAIESLFRSMKNNGNNLNAIRAGLGVLTMDVSDDLCKAFIDKFYDEICDDDYLYKKANLILQEKGIEYNKVEFQELNKKIEYNHADLGNKMDNMTETLYGNMPQKIVGDEKFQKNKKQDYINIWNSRLFLHMDNDVRSITLAEAFIMPDYKKYKFSNRMGFTDNDTLEIIIEKFFDYKKASTMLITGVPGIGKSTITSWIANKYKEDDRVIVLRFRDWESEELENGILKSICNTLECRNKDLEGKILVLDGFDEMKSLDIRMKLLNNFFNDIKDFGKLKCIITSRPTYISWMNFNNSIELRPFDNYQIRDFYKIIKGEQLTGRINYNIIDVFGIPVILYMAIMSNIDITKNTTKPELYNRIFAEEGGIFERFSFEGIPYSEGTHIFTNSENIEKYMEFLRNVAFMMYVKNNLSISKNQCQIPELEFQGKTVSVLEFPIKHLFENTEANIEFIHKSIYEFFVSEYIFKAIYNKLDISNEYLASVLGESLEGDILSIEVIEFLQYRVNKSDKMKNKFENILHTFELMLKNGMTYYVNKRLNMILQREEIVFVNMLYILHFWEFDSLHIDFDLLKYYLKGNSFNIDLSYINLMGADLKGINLEDSNIEGTNLRKTDLREANLCGANLRKANLSGADLRGADLRGAKVESSIWYDSDIRKALSQLKKSNFNSLLIRNGAEVKKVYRRELFPSKDNS